MARPGKGTGGEVKEKPKAVTRRPQLFHVVLINDDNTTMEFVVPVLESVFDKGPAEASRIMMEVHTRGRGVCGAVDVLAVDAPLTQVVDGCFDRTCAGTTTNSSRGRE